MLRDSRMESGPDNLVLRYLRDISAQLGEVRGDLREMKGRLGNLARQSAQQLAMYATLASRMDRLDERLARVERRLELREPVDA